MINGINSIDLVAGDKNLTHPIKPAGEQDKSFSDLLSDAVAKIGELEKDSQSKQLAFARGENIELHEVVIAMEKASIAMELAINMRNKVMEAYQEIMRMNV